VVLLVGETRASDIGGSSYLADIHGIEKGALPELNYTLERKTCDTIRELISKKLLSSCHDLSQGGLAVALAECCFSDYAPPKGVTLSLKDSSMRGDLALFAESGARFLISCEINSVDKVREIVKNAGLVVSGEGSVGGSEIAVSGLASISAQSAYSSWFNGLDHIFED
jgi:phosphoribosylformylglycinamidine synthase